MQRKLIISLLCSSSGLTDINNTGGADLTGIIYHLGSESICTPDNSTKGRELKHTITSDSERAHELCSIQWQNFEWVGSSFRQMGVPVPGREHASTPESAQNSDGAGPLPAPRCTMGNMAAGKPLCCVKLRTFLEKSAGNASRCLQNITKVFLNYTCMNSPHMTGHSCQLKCTLLLFLGFLEGGVTVEGLFHQAITWTRYKLMKSNRQFTLWSPILASEWQISAEHC